MLEIVRRAERLEHVEHRLVDDDRAVLGIGDDEGELVEAEPRVERVEHRAHRRDREVQLQMLRLIPHQRRDPVAVFDPERPQARREPTGTLGRFAERRAVDRAVGPPRNDLPRRASAAPRAPRPWSATAGSRPSSGRRSSGRSCTPPVRSLPHRCADRIRSEASRWHPSGPPTPTPTSRGRDGAIPRSSPSCPSRSVSCSPPVSASTMPPGRPARSPRSSCRSRGCRPTR